MIVSAFSNFPCNRLISLSNAFTFPESGFMVLPFLPHFFELSPSSLPWKIAF
jgi:hypothetical protein